MSTSKQAILLGKMVENGSTYAGKSLGQLMIEAGYSPNTARAPTKITKSKGFMELVDEFLPDNELMEIHEGLLKAKAIDHLVFPLAMSDEEITELVESVGGTVRKFKHGETANHVWFWAPHTKARQDALKLAYDVKGKLGKQDAPAASSVYNTFIQNNTLDPNAPAARDLAAKTLEILMEQTKRKVVPNG